MPSFTQSRYRWTKQFFDDDLLSVPRRKPKVFEAFQLYSGLSEAEAKRALQHGYIPSVAVKSLPGLYGFTPPTGDEIQLDKTFIEELEAALPANLVPRGRVHSPSELEERLMLLLEATVLHEMVHFFRLKFNQDARVNLRSRKGRGFEEAWAREFEKAAYRRVYTVQSLLITKYMPKTAAHASK